MPKLGDMEEGVIANWLKKEGDAVKKGDPIAEIETDKTTVEYEAFETGTLLKILVPAGGKAPVGSTIGVIGQPGEVVGAPAAAQSTPQTPATPVATPAATSVPAAAAPVASDNGRIIATPIAKRMAEERGLDLRLIKGSGPEGRIVKSDVENFQGAAAPVATPATPTPAPTTPVAPIATPVAPIATPVATPVAAATDAKIAEIATAAASGGAVVGGGDQRVALTRMRQIIAKRMVESKTQVPHFYVDIGVEMDAAMALRQQINESLKSEGVKISVNDMVVRAVALALKKYPAMNSSFVGDAIQRHAQVHVGSAVTVPDGLVTVTLKNTDAKSLRQISQEMVGLAQRARDNKMIPGDSGGQTFTISNLGMYGIDSFGAIVNQPDAGILAVGAAKPIPVVRDGQIVIRTMMNIRLSGDHRAIDGAIGAEFIAEIKRLLEAPWGLVL